MTVADSPNPFQGIWHRHFIQFDQGTEETTQSVLWIQAQSAFGDVRSVPYEGPLTAHRYRTMTWRQKFDTDLLGFAGHFTWQPSDESNGTCTWHHRLAITPRLRPDTSCYRWLGPDDFLEHGTCKDDQGQTHAFVEHWHRVHADPIHVWMLNRDGTRGQALIADPWAIVIYDLRKDPLTPSDPVSFEGFCAHAWQRVSGTWQIEFGSHAYLGTDPMWTPETLTHPGSEGAWQCTSPSLGQGGP